MTEQERLALRESIEKLLDVTFGIYHGCNVDINALMRSVGSTTVRFCHDGQYWKISNDAGRVSLVKD